VLTLSLVLESVKMCAIYLVRFCSAIYGGKRTLAQLQLNGCDKTAHYVKICYLYVALTVFLLLLIFIASYLILLFREMGQRVLW